MALIIYTLYNTHHLIHILFTGYSMKTITLCTIIILSSLPCFSQHWQVQENLPVSVCFRSVHFIDTSHGWMVGDSGTVLYYHDSSWEQVILPDDYTALRFHAVHATSLENIWVSGDKGTIIHFDGTGWKEVIHPLTGQQIPIRDIYFFDAHNGWASCDSIFLLKCTNDLWTVVTGDWFIDTIYFMKNLVSIDFTSPDNGWAVIQDRYNSILHWDGVTWKRQPVQYKWRYTLYDISAYDAQHVFAVGRTSGILRYEEDLWFDLADTNRAAERGAAFYTAVEMVDTAEVWLTHFYISGNLKANHASIRHYKQGILNHVFAVRKQFFYDIHFIDKEHGWAVGTVVARYGAGDPTAVHDKQQKCISSTSNTIQCIYNSAISYYCTTEGLLFFYLYSVNGKLIKKIEKLVYITGIQILHLDNFDLPAGVYFCNVVFNDQVHGTKVVLH